MFDYGVKGWLRVGVGKSLRTWGAGRLVGEPGFSGKVCLLG